MTPRLVAVYRRPRPASACEPCGGTGSVPVGCDCRGMDPRCRHPDAEEACEACGGTGRRCPSCHESMAADYPRQVCRGCLEAMAEDAADARANAQRDKERANG